MFKVLSGRKLQLVLVVLALIAILAVAGFNLFRAEPAEAEFSAVARQDDFAFELRPDESVESAMFRSQSAGTGYVYVDSNGEVSVEPAEDMYVTKVEGTFPKISKIEVMYMWKKGEGAEPMVCLLDTEMGDGGYQAFYCEAESIIGD